MPSGTVLSAFDPSGDTDSFGHNLNNATHVPTRWNASAIFPDSILNEYQPATLITFEAIQLSHPETDSAFPSAKAWRCPINFCLRTYSQISISNGIWSASGLEDRPLYHATVSGIYPGPVSDEWLEVLSTKMGDDEGLAAQVNMVDWQNLASYLQLIFSTGWYEGAAYTSTSIANSDNNAANGISSPSGDFSDAIKSLVPDVGGVLAETPNLPALIGHMAESMTEEIRMGPNSTQQSGTVFQTQTYIQVRWMYLALPIALAALTIFALLVAITESHKRKIVAWKSSSLALLFHELNGLDENDLTGITDTDGLEARAKRLKMTLARDQRPPTFEKVGTN
ncbi:MAG: hypothetical protein Q9227_003160 [Pyrenula ochraceoflavens]